MATEEITYRVDIKDPGDAHWTPWYGPQRLEDAKSEQLAILAGHWSPGREARIVEVRRTWTETVLQVDAANLTILSREEL